jgi:hypothetical protein
MTAFVVGALLGSLVGVTAMAVLSAQRCGDLGRTLLGPGRWTIEVDESGDIVCAVQSGRQR